LVVDGPTLVTEALDAGLELTAAYVDADQPLDPTLRSRLHGQGVRVLELAPGVLAAATDTVTSQGIAALARRPERPLRFLTSTAAGLLLVLVDVADPGNVGTLLRSGAAAGAKGAVVCGGADPFGPKAVRASAGAAFRLPVVEHRDSSEVLDLLGRAGFRRVGTVVRDGVDHDRVDLVGPTALVLGNEAHGLSTEAQAQLDERLTIPMTDAHRELERGDAGTVVLFEMARQRRATDDQRPPRA
jgi:TrmH family RNA methyltransferase